MNEMRFIALRIYFSVLLFLISIPTWSSDSVDMGCPDLEVYLNAVLSEAKFNDSKNHPDIFSKISDVVEKDCEFKGKALTIQGVLHYTTGDILKAKESYFKAEKILSKLPNSASYALNQLNLGIVYVLEQNNDNALICFKRSLSISQELGNKFESADASMNMGLVKLELDELDEAEAHLNVASEALSEIKTLPTHGYVYYNLSRLHVKRGNYEEALKLNNNAKEVWKSINDNKGLYFYSRLQSKIYSLLDNVDKEIFYLKQALDYTGNTGIKLAQANFDLGSAYVQNNQPANAVRYLKASVKDAQLADPEDIKFAITELYKIYKEQNDEKAITTLLDDVVGTFKLNKDLAKLTEDKLLEKDVGVDTLNKLNLSLTQAKNEIQRRSNLQFWLFSIGGLLAILSLGYIIKLNRAINENNKILKTNNNELAEYSNTINVQNEMLASKNEELQNFAYTASHDIKSPLNTIMSYAKLLPTLVDRGDDEKVKIFANTIDTSCTRLSDLVTDLLEYAKIDQKKLSITKIVSSAFFGELKSSLESELSAKKAALIIDESLPDSFQGDKIKLTQLFQNLISNSIKFSKEDIVPKIIIRSENGEVGTHIFKIQDNGIGIAQEHLDKIFNMFEKLHSDSEFAGTGIGLAVCQKVAMIHKGSLDVDSKEGIGTTFTLRLPKELEIL